MMELLRRRPVRVGASVAMLPLVVAVIVLLGRPWAPVLDLAMTEFRVRDVGGRFTPRIGLPGRIGNFPEQGSHPGPWSFYLIAPIYRLGGASAWGMQLGSVVVNSAAFTCVVWIGRRLFGSTGAIAMAAVVAVAIRGFGLDVLTQPWNPYFPLAIWLLLLVAAWGVLAGDHRLAVVVAVCGSLAAQTHVPYLVSCLLVSLLVLAVLVARWRRSDGRERSEVRRSTLLASAVVVVMWLPPIVDELRREPGNLTMLWRHFTGEPSEPVVPLTTAIKVFLRHLDVFGAGWAVITRSDGFVHRSGLPTTSTASAIGGAIVLMWWVVAAVTAWRRGHRLLNALNVVLGVALVAAMVSISRIFGKVWYYLTLWAWMTLLLIVVSIVWAMVLVVRDRMRLPSRSVSRSTTTAAAGVTAVATCLSLAAVIDHEVPEPQLSEGLRAVVDPTIDAIDAGVGAAVGRDGSYLVFWQDSVFIGSQGYGLVNELERRGIDAGVHDTWRVPVTHHRVLTPGTFDAEIHLVSGDYIVDWRERTGHLEVANVDVRSAAERDRFDALRARVGERLDELGRPEFAETVDRNLFGASLDPDLPQDVIDDLSEMLSLGEPVSIFIAPPGSTS